MRLTRYNTYKIILCLIATLGTQGCGSNSEKSDSLKTEPEPEPKSAAQLDAQAATSSLAVGARTLRFRTRLAPFPRLRGDNTLVHLPPTFQYSQKIPVILFFHGFHGCISVVAGNQDVPCVPGGRTARHLNLISQVNESGTSAILIIPQMGSPRDNQEQIGGFAQTGFMRDYLNEVLTKVGSMLGVSMGIDQLGPLMLASHSAGYIGILAALRYGQISPDEIVLLDSFYAGQNEFRNWIQSNSGRFILGTTKTVDSNPPARFISLFQEQGRVQRNSEHLLQWIKEQPGLFDTEKAILHRPFGSNLSHLGESDVNHSFVISAVPGDHAGVARSSFLTILRGSEFGKTDSSR